MQHNGHKALVTLAGDVDPSDSATRLLLHAHLQRTGHPPRSPLQGIRGGSRQLWAVRATVRCPVTTPRLPEPSIKPNSTPAVTSSSPVIIKNAAQGCTTQTPPALTQLDMGLPLRMSNIHAPTVPSGPTSAPTTNGHAGQQRSFAELQRAKDDVEAELKALGGVLDSVSTIRARRSRGEHADMESTAWT